MSRNELLNTVAESEHIFKNSSQNGLKKIARMENLSQNKLKQIVKCKIYCKMNLNKLQKQDA